MPIYFEDVEIVDGNLKLDDVDIVAVYRGNQQIWPVTPPAEVSYRTLQNGDFRLLQDGT